MYIRNTSQSTSQFICLLLAASIRTTTNTTRGEHIDTAKYERQQTDEQYSRKQS